MAKTKTTEPTSAASSGPSLDDVDTVGGPIYQTFTYSSNEALVAENRSVHQDVARLEMAEDLFLGNELLIGVIESDLGLTDHKLLGETDRGALLRFLIVANRAAGHLLAEDRDSRQRWIDNKHEREQRAAAQRDFEARR